MGRIFSGRVRFLWQSICFANFNIVFRVQALDIDVDVLLFAQVRISFSFQQNYHTLPCAYFECFTSDFSLYWIRKTYGHILMVFCRSFFPVVWVTYMIPVQFTESTPNLGLFWYFFLQIFERFWFSFFEFS